MTLELDAPLQIQPLTTALWFLSSQPYFYFHLQNIFFRAHPPYDKIYGSWVASCFFLYTPWMFSYAFPVPYISTGTNL